MVLFILWSRDKMVTLTENTRKTSRKNLYSDAEIAAISWHKKSGIIEGDPVT